MQKALTWTFRPRRTALDFEFRRVGSSWWNFCGINQILASNPIDYVVPCGNSQQSCNDDKKPKPQWVKKDNTFCCLSICARHNFYTEQLITFADGPDLMNKGTLQIELCVAVALIRIVSFGFCGIQHWNFKMPVCTRPDPMEEFKFSIFFHRRSNRIFHGLINGMNLNYTNLNNCNSVSGEWIVD